MSVAAEENENSSQCQKYLSEGMKADEHNQSFSSKVPSIDDFIFVKPISRGAFGKVFLGHKKNDEKKMYAIKVMKKADMVNKNMVSQVKAERDALAVTKSPFVVKLFYSLQSKQNIYLVMDYMIGGDVKSLLSIYGYFDEEMAAMYTAEVAMALQYLHRHGIVHRDLKPDNMLISNEGHIKLTDFGLSKISMNRQISVGDVLNTPSLNSNSRPDASRTPGQVLSLTSALAFSVPSKKKTSSTQSCVSCTGFGSLSSLCTPTFRATERPRTPQLDLDFTPPPIKSLTPTLQASRGWNSSTDSKIDPRHTSSSSSQSHSTDQAAEGDDSLFLKHPTFSLSGCRGSNSASSAHSLNVSTTETRSSRVVQTSDDNDTPHLFRSKEMISKSYAAQHLRSLRNCSFSDDEHDSTEDENICPKFLHREFLSSVDSIERERRRDSSLSPEYGKVVGVCSSVEASGESDKGSRKKRPFRFVDMSPPNWTCSGVTLPSSTGLTMEFDAVVLGDEHRLKRFSLTSDREFCAPSSPKDNRVASDSDHSAQLSSSYFSDTDSNSGDSPQHQVQTSFEPQLNTPELADNSNLSCIPEDTSESRNMSISELMSLRNSPKRVSSVSVSEYTSDEESPQRIRNMSVSENTSDKCDPLLQNPKVHRETRESTSSENGVDLNSSVQDLSLDEKSANSASISSPENQSFEPLSSVSSSNRESSESTSKPTDGVGRSVCQRSKSLDSSVFLSDLDTSHGYEPSGVATDETDSDQSDKSLKSLVCPPYISHDRPAPALSKQPKNKLGVLKVTRFMSLPTSVSDGYSDIMFHTPAPSRQSNRRFMTPGMTPGHKAQTPFRTPKSVRRGPVPDTDQRILGTPDYLAPELLLQTEHGPAVDWWALGVCLFEFLTGVPPFNDQTADLVFQNILNRDIPWPEDEEALSAEAHSAIDGLLQFDINARLTYTDLKQHPLFSCLEWDNLLSMTPAFVPNPDDAMDTCYFDARNNLHGLQVSDIDM